MRIKAGHVVGWTVLASSVVGCGAAHDEGATDPGVGDTERIETPSASAVQTLKALRSKYVLSSDDKAVHGVVDRVRSVIGSGSVRYKVDSGRLRANLRRDLERPLRVELPATSDRAVLLNDVTSGMKLGVRLENATASVGQAVDDAVVYERGLDARFDVVQRATETGAEDFVHVTSPGTTHLAYEVTLDDKVAGVRSVSNAVEFLDENGAPALRMSPPYLIDSAGEVKWATVSVSGCAYDSSPLPPFDRPTVPPESRTCRIDLSWSSDDVQYPVLVDPLWSSTSTLGMNRYGHSQSYYEYKPDGVNTRLIIAGGQFSNTQFLKSTELYDSATRTWTFTGELNDARSFHVGISRKQVSANIGHYLVAGGSNSGGVLSTSEIYTFATGTWTRAANLNSPRANFAIASLDTDKVVVAGGFNGTTVKYTTEVYDFVANTWTWGVPMAFPRQLHRMTAIRLPNANVGGRNDLIVSGGLDELNRPVAATERFSAFWNFWTQPGPLPVPVFGHAAVQVKGQTACGANCDNSVFVIGGMNAQFAQVPDIQKFQPAANSWTRVDRMLDPRAFHCATLMDRSIKSGDTIFWSGGTGRIRWEHFHPLFGFNSGNTAGARIHSACGPIAPNRILTTGGINDAGASIGLYEEFQ